MKRRPLTAEEKADADRLNAAWLAYKSEHKGATQTWLAAETGLGTQGAVGQYLRAVIPLNLDALLAFSKVLKVAPETISKTLARKLPIIGTPMTFGEVARSASRHEANAVDARTAGKLPLISWVQAGTWTQIVDNFHPGDAADWIPCPFNHGPNAFILRVVGNSMHNPGGDKSYADGDFIAVDPSRDPHNKSLVVVRENGDQTATFKQLLIEPNGNFMLQALNPNWPNRIQRMPENSDIVGVVIGKWVPE